MLQIVETLKCMWIFATSTKICTSGGFTQDFGSHHHDPPTTACLYYVYGVPSMQAAIGQICF